MVEVDLMTPLFHDFQGLDSSGRPAFVLYFRVRYYVDTPLLLR